MNADARAIVAAIDAATDFRTVAQLLVGCAHGEALSHGALQVVLHASWRARQRLEASSMGQVSVAQHAIQVSRQRLRSSDVPFLVPQVFEPFRHEGPSVSPWQADHGL
jgi:hypothetical protein